MMARSSASTLLVPLLAAALYACSADPEASQENDSRAGNTGAPAAAASENASAGDAQAALGETPSESDSALPSADAGDADQDGLSQDATAEAEVYDGDAADAGPDASASDAKFDSPVPNDATVVDAKPDVADAADATVVIDSGPPLDCTKVGPDGEPIELGCTTLYSSWAAKTIAATARPYEPAYRAWSDGTQKSRYIELPAGQKIDATDANEWTFPVGTRFYKEFRLNGRRVETRLLWKKNASQWTGVTYAWSYDQTSARILRTGQTNVWGTSYEIPPQSDCETCHMGKLDRVLGFEVVSLSNAGASGMTLAALAAQSFIAPVPAAVTIPGNATEKAALGYLHVNCGLACHTRSHYGLAKPTGLFMRIESGKVATVAATDTFTTAVNVPSTYQPTPGAGFKRIKPNDVAHSAIHYRASSRVAGTQMPPQSTHVVDTAGMALITNWINGM